MRPLLLFMLGLFLLSPQLTAQETGVAGTQEAAPDRAQNATAETATVNTSDDAAEDQDAAADSPTVLAEGMSYLLPPVTPPAGAWVELTPLGLEGQGRFFDLNETELYGPTDPGLPEGPAMVCSGAAKFAAGCRRVYLYRSLQRRGEAAQDLEIAVDFEDGLIVVGRYLMDALPVVDARVRVMPARLEASRAFTLPLAMENGELIRDVRTDDDGFFRLPPLGQGSYRLETLLPTGRVHRPDPFELPAASGAQDQIGSIGADGAVVWDLGELEVEDWLAVEVHTLDQSGQPIADARVAARQGSSRRNLVSFRGRTDQDGQVRLSGFDVEQPMRLDCSAPGYRSWGADYELLPVEVVCSLQKLARIEGHLLDLLGQIPPAAAISALAEQDPTELEKSARAEIARPDAAGRFRLDVAPGQITLTVAAPGYLADRRQLRLDAGEEVDLGEITLAPGRQLVGRVVEAPQPPDGPPPLIVKERQPQPIAGVEVRAIEPPGAAWAISDAEGLFQLSSIGEATLELEFRAEGFAAKRLKLDRAAQRRDEPFTVELERGGWIQVLVGHAGEPCAGCLLSLEPGAFEMRTDGDGEALTPALRPGRYRVERPQVIHLGTQVLEIPAAMTRSTRVVAGEISTVRFELEPERLAIRFEPPQADDWWMVARSPFGEERLDPEADGLFHPPHPKAAPQHLFLTRFDAQSGHDLEVLVATLEPSFRAPENEALILALPGGQIRGRVQNRAGRAHGVRVRLQKVADGLHAAELRTDAEGRFHLPHVPPGVYSLVLGERAFQFISIADGTSLDLGDFQIIEGGF